MKTVKGQKIARLLLLTTMFSSLAFAGPKKTSPIILSLDEIRAAQEQISIVSKQTTDRNAVASLRGSRSFISSTGSFKRSSFWN
jgi:hypothetical protein